MIYRLLVLTIAFSLGFISNHNAQEVTLKVDTQSRKQDSLATIYLFERVFRNQNELQESLNRAKDSLLKDGYFRHSFSQLILSTDTTYSIRFFSGTRTQILKLSYDFKNLKKHAEGLKLKSDSSYLYIEPKNLQKSLRAFTILDAEQGSPLTSYSLVNFRLEKDTAYAQLLVKKERKRKLDDIIIKGYEKFPTSFLKNYAKLKVNDAFNDRQIAKGISNLEKLPFISQPKEADILFKPDSTTLYLYVEKENANRFEGFLGFASKESDTGLRLDGYLDLQLENILNYGESLNFQFKGNGDDQQILEASLRMPYIFKTPLSLTPALQLFRQDSSFSNSRKDLKIDYTISPQAILYTKASFLNSEKLSTSQFVNIESFRKDIYLIGIELVDQDSAPSFENSYLKASAGYATRTANENKVNQLLLHLETGHAFYLNDKNIFYIKNETEYLSPQEVFENELFRFGGMQTLRGYKENSLVTSFYSAIQTEYRYKPVRNFILNSVFDVAYLKSPITQQTEESGLLYGVGFGGSILTNAGWLRINLAAPFAPNEKLRFSNSIMHLSLIANF